MSETNVNIPNIDEWVPEPEDIIFSNSKNIIIDGRIWIKVK